MLLLSGEETEGLKARRSLVERAGPLLRRYATSRD